MVSLFLLSYPQPFKRLNTQTSVIWKRCKAWMIRLTAVLDCLKKRGKGAKLGRHPALHKTPEVFEQPVSTEKFRQVGMQQAMRIMEST